MKKTKLAVAAAALFVVLLASHAGSVAILNVSISKYEPYPAQPGNYLDVWVKVENAGNTEAEDVIVAIEPIFPFSVADEEQKNLGAIPAGKTQIEKFRLKVADTAVEGYNTLKIKSKTKSGGFWLITEENILVRTGESVLNVESARSEPEVIPPGSEAIIEIKLSNDADSAFRNINIKLDLSSKEIPLAPLRSTAEKRIAVLEGRGKATVQFEVVAESDAAGGVYKVPLEISYVDSAGASHAESAVVGVVIGDIPDIYVAIDSTEITMPGEAGAVTFKVINRGLTDVKYLNLELGESPDYRIISPSRTAYIGNLDSDDYESAEFRIYVEETTKGTIELPLTLEYRDVNNRKYEESIKVPLKLYTKQEAAKYRLDGRGGILNVKNAAVAAIALYVFYRYRKKKRRK